jgi:hypothetical protein
VQEEFNGQIANRIWYSERTRQRATAASLFNGTIHVQPRIRTLGPAHARPDLDAQLCPELQRGLADVVQPVCGDIDEFG